jgi:hypothetical protein
MKNNPVYLFLNAYKVGWMSFLDEDTVIRIWRYSGRVRPFLNFFVGFIETVTILILFSRPAAVLIILLVLSFHFLIFASAGDNFWMWGVVNLAIMGGIIFISQPLAIFADMRWLALSMLFIGFSRGWMKPVGMSWLDSPYVEYILFEGELEDGSRVKINTNILRPYHGITQGTTGTLTYLGENPRLTFSFGNINEPELKKHHERLLELLYDGPPDDEEAKEIVEMWGMDKHDETMTKNLEDFLRRFISNYSNSGAPQMFRYISPPPGFYSIDCSYTESNRMAP